jgi:CelD/BcsL family acetyltransferase involved in cellulose biosynthesis
MKIDFAGPTSIESHVSVQRVDTAEGMLALRDAWHKLTTTTENPNVFNTFAWCWGWWTHVAPHHRGGAQRLQILVVRHGNEVTGIAPLMLRSLTSGGVSFRKLEFLGGSDISDYQAPLFARDAALHAQAIARYLAATTDQWDVLELHNLSAHVCEPLRNALAAVCHMHVAPGESCPFVAIQGSSETATPQMSSKRRHNLRNQRMRLLRAGFTDRIIERPDLEAGLLDRIVELESRKLVNGKAGQTVCGRWPEFFRYIFQELGAQDRIKIAVLEKGAQLIAYNLHFRCGHSLWTYSPAYDPAFAKLSPGATLLAMILDYACQHGYREYDFLRGMEPYKLQCATGVRRTFNLQVSHSAPRSRIGGLLLRLRSTAKRLLRDTRDAKH